MIRQVFHWEVACDNCDKTEITTIDRNKPELHDFKEKWIRFQTTEDSRVKHGSFGILHMCEICFARYPVAMTVKIVSLSWRNPYQEYCRIHNIT